ncbi:MAG: DUF11 domain-containing protein, partial [Demequinaceae bacterium]|nr:DUF11 domain-containing protein [Demequinaceae bacterium]
MATAAVVLSTTLVYPAAIASAADVPTPVDAVYVQTSGPNAPITRGDWYAGSPTGTPPGGGTDHMVQFLIPRDWPAGTPITISIFDPEMYGTGSGATLSAGDEVYGTGPDDSTYWLEDSLGTVLATETYLGGDSTTHGVWDHLVTFIPTADETYQFHATALNDDDNGWRVRAVYDPDCAVGTNTCSAAQLDNGNETDNPDGIEGTGDELELNPVRAGYQHDVAAGACNTFYYFVEEGVTQVDMRNFDMDGNTSVTHTRADGSSVAGTVSTNGTWAYDTVTVAPGQAGWWHTTFCFSSNNLYVFEQLQRYPIYMDSIPSAPELTISKDDGVATAEWGDTLNYTITVDNVSDAGATPGKAYDVVVTDAIPAGLTYVSCSMGGAAGSCSESGGVVTWTLADGLYAGEDVDLGLDVTVDYWHYGTIVNTAVGDYVDAYGNNYPDILESDDVNTIEPPSFVVTKTSDTGGVLVDAGQTIEYTILIQSPTTSSHTNVVVTDALPAGMEYVPGSTVVEAPGASAFVPATDDFSSGNYTGGSGWLTNWTEISDDGNTGSGDVQIAQSGPDSGQAVWMRFGGNGIQRTFDVTDATSASLEFELYTPNSGDFEGTDYLEWGIRVDGGGFQQLGTDYGAASPNPYTISEDLSPYLPASSIQLQFIAHTTQNTEWYQVDDVSITGTIPGAIDIRDNDTGGTLDSGVPPTLVTAADGIDLAGGEEMTITYSVLVTDPIASATQRYVTNTATVTSDQETTGKESSVTDELDRTPVLIVDKAGPATAFVGDTVTYDFAVSHDVSSDGSPVSGLTVVDDIAGAATYDSGDDGDGLLESGETWLYSVDYTIGGGDADPLVNTVSIDGTDLNGEAIPTATDTHSVDIEVPTPGIAISKTTSDSLVAGGTITYTLEAENTGNVTLTGVQISEGLVGATVVGSCDPVTLAPAATTSCTFEYTATQADVDAGSLTNSASVVGTPPSGPDVTDTDAVTLTATAGPSISLTKTTSDSLVAGGTIT